MTSPQSTLAAALVAARAEIPAITKDSVNPHFKNRYASLDTIIETAPRLAAEAARGRSCRSGARRARR